jgi:hypothetical protein
MIVIFNGESGCGCNRHRKRAVKFNYKLGQIKKKEVNPMSLELKITNEEKINVKLVPVTASNTPAKLDGKPTWVVTSGNSTVVVSDDGLSADLVSEDGVGDTVFTVTADADLGSGVTDISDTVTLTVVDPQAQSLGLVAGTPVPKNAVV